MERSPERLIQMASAFYESQILFTAIDAGVFDTLHARKTCTAAELAATQNLDSRGARLLLDGCVALGMLVKEGDQYRNGAEAETFLVSGAPGDLTRAMRYNRDVYNAWGKLHQFVRTGKPVEEPDEHLGDNRERTRTFVHAMHGRAMGIGRAVVPQLELHGCRRLLDVGGGPGTYSVLIAQQYPEIDCTVLDLPVVIEFADELIAAQGMSERVSTMPGNYREVAFPDDQDAILFFGMFHQESKQTIRDLLRKAWHALNPGGSVYVLDMMTDESYTKPVFSALFAVNMALTTDNGWVFSDKDLQTWFRECGFVDTTIQPLPPPMPHWLANARKPH